MKILILINGLYPETIGGIEKIGSDLAANLAGEHEVLVYTKLKSALASEETRDGYRIKRFKSANDYKFKVPMGIRTIRLIGELRREHPRPDIVLSMSLGFGFTGSLFKRFFGIPFLIYVLGTDWYIARDTFLKGAAFKLGIRKCNSLMTQTKIIKKDILKYFPKCKIDVVPNGIYTHDRRAGGDKILFLGRLSAVKGIRYLIEAARILDNCPGVVIGGTGPEEKKLKRLAAGANVTFAGRVGDVQEFFMQGRIFVLPSLSEGLPQVILEAMSCGLPVIATRVGGVPDVVEHGKTGFLVDPGDPRQLAEYAGILLGDEALRREMRSNCLRAVQNYSWDIISAKIAGLMDRALRGD